MLLPLPIAQERPWRASGRLCHGARAAARHRTVLVVASGEAGGSASRDAVLARIKKAKEYKTAPKPAEPAVEGTQAGSSVGSPAAGSSVGSPAAASSPAGTGQGATGAEAVLARIQKAREYQQAMPPAVQAPGATGTTGPADDAAIEQQQQQQSVGAPGSAAAAAAGQGGGAQQAAGWLQSVVSKDVEVDANLRMEEISLKKEEEVKKLGAEVIVGRAFLTRRDKVDFSAPELEGQAAVPQAAAAAPAAGAAVQPEQQEEEEEQEEGVQYKPKVATWGVFPRPQNISQAYGGGRNLKPGQALESKEEAKEREARVQATLQRYRKQLGMEVDPKAEADAQALCDEGGELFKQGAISLALEKYAAAAELVPSRNKVGGEARLRQAICLDSLGRNNEAYEIYKTVKSHPNAAIAKQANRMLFGFKAAESLKVGSVSYAPPSQAWQAYFDRISKGSWNSAYYAAETRSGEEEGGGANEGWILWVAAGVVLAPLALVAVKVASVRLE